MLNFLLFRELITEDSSTVALSASGREADRHTQKYITPYLPGNPKHQKDGTHNVTADVKGLSAGDRVLIHTHHVATDEKGKQTHHVTVSKVGSRTKVTIPTSKLYKPVKANNRGFEGEGTLTKHLNKHKLMKGEGAGATAGNDFYLEDKRQGTSKKIAGSEGISNIQGEHKSDIRTTAFGQLTLSRHPETRRWYIDDKARAKRPEYAKHIEAATVTVNGKTKPLLDHLNDVEPEGTTNKTGFTSDATSTDPAHAYMKDHHVDVVHIDSHGTYRAGQSISRDRHKLGLPPLKGEGKFRVRQKTSDPNKRTVQFSITKLEKSNIHIGTDEGAEIMKQRLGHK